MNYINNLNMTKFYAELDFRLEERKKLKIHKNRSVSSNIAETTILNVNVVAGEKKKDKYFETLNFFFFIIKKKKISRKCLWRVNGKFNNMFIQKS